MSEPFIGEIKIFGCNFAPRNWAFCDGQLLPIAQNQYLYAVISTTYGGDGRTTFGIPNLQGRVPIGSGHGPGLQLRQVGQMGGSPKVSLTQEQIPSHTHEAVSMGSGDKDTNPQGKFVGSGYGYVNKNEHPVSMSYAALQTTGHNQPHENRQPFIAMNFCIALDGVFPSRN